MRDDFCAFILSYGRPDRVKTYKALRGAGYTGRIFIVVDDLDKTGPEYLSRYGNEVVIFDKQKAALATDAGDNSNDLRTVLFARNVCHELAKQVGCRYFIELDDDYTSFTLRWNGKLKYCTVGIRKTMDECLEAMLDYYAAIPAACIAMAQGGDHLGGGRLNSSRGRDIYTIRKAMNSFICSTDRPFSFTGRLNDDVNTYTVGSRKGMVFLTIMQIVLRQTPTQANPGGLTELYLDVGTYVKSFFTVMYAPSCAKVATLEDSLSPNPRIHHNIDWKLAAPCILREEHRKPSLIQR